jgi:hypothetical protein
MFVILVDTFLYAPMMIVEVVHMDNAALIARGEEIVAALIAANVPCDDLSIQTLAVLVEAYLLKLFPVTKDRELVYN